MDGLALHYYTRILDTSLPTPQKDGNVRYLRRPGVPYFSATNFEINEWNAVMRAAAYTEELIVKHSAIMDRYDPEKRVALVIDEWGTWFGVDPGTNPGFLYQQNTLRDALVAGLSLNIFNNHADRVRMANLAQTINVLQAVILTEGAKMILTPTYHVFDMYKAHQGAALLDFALVSDDYSFEGAALKTVSASASKTDEGKINITLCNIDPEKSAPVKCVFDKLVSGDRISGTILTSELMSAHNTFDSPDTVHPSPFLNFKASNDILDINMPPKSAISMVIE